MRKNYNYSCIYCSGKGLGSFDSGNDFISELKSLTKSEGSISRIAFFGHSDPVRVYFKYGTEGKDPSLSVDSKEQSSVVETLDKLVEVIESGEIVFDANAIIIFGGCNTGGDDVNVFHSGTLPLIKWVIQN